MEYLSDIINNKSFESLTNKSDHLLIANAGSGKTVLLLDNFTSWAKDQNKTILYLYNRKSMKNQFALSYAKKHSNLTINSYQYLENKYSSKLYDICKLNTDYLEKFDYILCDECHYFVCDSLFNKNIHISFEVINRSKAIKLYFTATPSPFIFISNLLSRQLKTIDLSSFTDKNINSIYICKNKQFNSLERKFLKNNTIIHFENNKIKNKELVKDLNNKGYAAYAISRENIDNISDSILNNNRKISDTKDFIATTSVCENGVNFNIEGNALVSFPKFQNWTSLEQSAARVRTLSNNEVSMLYCLPHFNKITTMLEYNNYDLRRLKLRKEEIIESSDFLHSNISLDFEIAMIEYINEELFEIIDYYRKNGKDHLSFFIKKLQNIYPDAKITILDKYDAIDAVMYFDGLMGKSNKLLIDPITIKDIKDRLEIGPKIIKEQIAGVYTIEPKRITKNGVKETYWIIERLQK